MGLVLIFGRSLDHVDTAIISPSGYSMVVACWIASCTEAALGKLLVHHRSRLRVQGSLDKRYLCSLPTRLEPSTSTTVFEAIVWLPMYSNFTTRDLTSSSVIGSLFD